MWPTVNTRSRCGQAGSPPRRATFRNGRAYACGKVQMVQPTVWLPGSCHGEGALTGSVEETMTVLDPADFGKIPDYPPVGEAGCRTDVV